MNKYCQFIFEDNDNNKKIYVYLKDNGDNYYLRCKDRNCEERAIYYIEFEDIKITKDCTIEEFESHNYIKEKIFIEKIKNNDVIDDDFKKSRKSKILF